MLFDAPTTWVQDSRSASLENERKPWRAEFKLRKPVRKSTRTRRRAGEKILRQKLIQN